MELKPSALAGWVLLFVLLFLCLMNVILSLASPYLVAPAQYVLIIALDVFAFGIPTLFLTRYRPLQGLADMRVKPLRGSQIGFTVSAALALTFLSVFASMLTSIKSGVVTAAPEGYYVSISAVPMPLVWLAIAVVPAIFEELLMRGALFSLYERRGTLTAILMTSLAFSLLHGYPDSLLPALISGIGYGLLVYVTGSIFAPMIAHLINNTYSIFTTWAAGNASFLPYWDYFLSANVILFFLFLYIALRFLENLMHEERVALFEKSRARFSVSLTGAMNYTGFILFVSLFLFRLAYLILFEY